MVQIVFPSCGQSVWSLVADTL